MLRLVIPAVLGCALLASACRLTSDGGIVGVFTPGATGRVEFVTTTFAGGRAMIHTERVDSAQSTVELEGCTQPIGGGNCTQDFRVVRSIAKAELDSIFRLVSSPQFRAVRDSYERVSDIVPPDDMQVRLEVTVHERRRTITWSRGAAPPDILEHLKCLVSAAGGSLVLCAAID